MRRLRSAVVAFLAASVLLSSCSLLGFGPPGTSAAEAVAERQALVRMAQVVEAINARDVAALTAMFSDYARADYAAGIDRGLDYLLSVLEDGDLVWDEEDGGSHASESWSDGGRELFVGSSFRVTSGGKAYSLAFDEYTVNESRPDNVGLVALSAVLSTESENSPLEVARSSWRGSDAPPGVFIGDDGPLSRERMMAIVDALNRQDASALTGMFTEYARVEHSADLDEGLAYLLSLFPNGDVVWEDGQGASAITERVLDGERTVLQTSFDTVMSGGVAYRLFFAEFTENELDPDNVGIYAVGAVPQAEYMYEVPEAFLHHWVETFEVTADGHPGVFIPNEELADVQMRLIEAAIEKRDADALKGLFSPYALEQAENLDDGLAYLLGLVGDGDLTWTLHEVDSFAVRESGQTTQFVTATYQVSGGGNDYRLFFSTFPVNEVRNPDNVGLYALGVKPWARDPETGCIDPFDRWACAMSVNGSTERGYAGIYVPE